MTKLDLIKSLVMFLAVVLTVAKQMPDFMGRKQSAQKDKKYNDEIARIGGKVVDVRQADSRTYMQVRSDNGREFWLTTREIDVKEGDRVAFEMSVPRQDYFSKDMRRNFAEIYVADQLEHIKQDVDVVS